MTDSRSNNADSTPNKRSWNGEALQHQATPLLTTTTGDVTSPAKSSGAASAGDSGMTITSTSPRVMTSPPPSSSASSPSTVPIAVSTPEKMLPAVDGNKAAPASAGVGANGGMATSASSLDAKSVSATSFAKSIPIHCTVCNVEIDTNGNRVSNGGGLASADAKDDQYRKKSSILNNSSSLTGDLEDRGMSDTYVIIPTDTPFADLVPTALAKLGYSSLDCAYATGSIIVKNWKPLGLQDVCISEGATVGEMLSEMTTMITLSIRVYRRAKNIWMENVREKLANLALGFVSAQSGFVNSGCPVDQSILANILEGASDPRLPEGVSDDVKNGLDHWLSQQMRQMALMKQQVLAAAAAAAATVGSAPGDPSGDPSSLVRRSHPSLPTPGALPSAPTAISSLATTTPPHHQGLPPLPPLRHQSAPVWHHPAQQSGIPQSQHPPAAAGPGSFPQLIPNGAHDHHFDLKVSGGLQMQRVRVRTSFDSELELPKLQQWFAENPHPSKQQIQEYVRILNSQESRRGRKQLDVTNVMYWFKNARAAHKRAEIRHHQHHQPHQHLQTPPPSGTKTSSLPQPLGSNSFNNFSFSSGVGKEGKEGDDDDMDDGELEMTDLDDDEADDSTVSSNQHRCIKTEMDGDPQVKDLRAEDDENEEKRQHDDFDDDVDDDDDDDDDEDDRDDFDKHAGKLKGFSPIGGSQAVFPHNNQQQQQVFHEDYMRRFGSLGNFHPHQSPSLAFMNPRIAAAIMTNPYVQHSLANMSGMDLTNATAREAAAAAAAMNFSTHMNQAAPAGGPESPLHLSTSSAAAAEERKKRNRTFIDPVTEVPRLEQWFSGNSHPPHSMILRFTQELNSMPYRQKFPKLEAKNVQFWFKNRRAKCKRMKLSL